MKVSQRADSEGGESRLFKILGTGRAKKETEALPMKRIIALNQNREFKKLYARGKSAVGRMVVVYYKKNAAGAGRLGITVSKKTGKAVVRSRVRRIIREAYRLEAEALLPGIDMVIVARGRAVHAKCQDIRRELCTLWIKEGLVHI